MGEKIRKLLEILEDLTLEQWCQIKNEVDIAYRDIEYKKVTNSQLETLKENLVHKLNLWNMNFMSTTMIMDPYEGKI